MHKTPGSVEEPGDSFPPARAKSGGARGPASCPASAPPSPGRLPRRADSEANGTAEDTSLRSGPPRPFAPHPGRPGSPGQGGPILPAVAPKLLLKRAPRRRGAVTAALRRSGRGWGAPAQTAQPSGCGVTGAGGGAGRPEVRAGGPGPVLDPRGLWTPKDSMKLRPSER